MRIPNEKPAAFQDDDWEDLIASLTEQRRVVPVVGEELSRVVEAGGTRIAWADLLRREMGLDGAADLNGGTTGFRIEVSRTNDRLLRRVLEGELRSRRGEAAHAGDLRLTEEMRQLVEIGDFRLLLTTATDGLLLLAARLAAGETEDLLADYPDKKRRLVALHCDISREPSLHKFPFDLEYPPAGCGAPVFHLFGLRRSGDRGCALADSQQLETIINVIKEPGYSELLSYLTRNDVIVLGNRLPDCFTAAFIRLVKGGPVDAAVRQEVFAPGRPNPSDPSLLRFLARHGRTMLFEDGDTEGFVRRLHAAWLAKRPREAKVEAMDDMRRPPQECVFISYASEDRELAGEVARFLESRHIPVWLDTARLRGGERWDDVLRLAVRQCRLFLPLCTENSLRKPPPGGRYYLQEWDCAIREAPSRAGNVYIFPYFAEGLSPAATSYLETNFRLLQETQGMLGKSLFTDKGHQEVLNAYNAAGGSRRA